MSKIDPKGDIGAVIVTHHPKADFIELIDCLKSQVSLIVVVDNGSNDLELETFFQESKANNLELVRNPLNLGIAKGLNQGADILRQRGFRWMLAIDQDSRPYPDMVMKLRSVYLSSGDPQKIALVAPNIVDSTTRRQARYLRPWLGFFYRRDQCSNQFLDKVVLVLSSGSLYDLKIIDMVGRFREDFFIDYVDSEYCLRLLERGYKIRVACEAKLGHRLGKRRVVQVGQLRFFPTFHSPVRWYYISRNRIPMLRMYALKFPHWLSFEIVSSVYIFFRMLLLEDHRLKKIIAIFYGTLDGLRGRMGEISPEIATKLRVPET